MHFRYFFFAFVLASISFFVGCQGHQPPAPGGDATGIPFDLALPGGIAKGDYYAVAGVKSEQQQTLINDSTIVDVPITRFYAEFFADNGGPVDFNVFVNTAQLQRHHNGDTLRLRSTFDTSVVKGDQLWKLREPGELSLDLTRFTLPAVDFLDTIGPFEAVKQKKGLIRSDTSLTIVWDPGRSAGAMRIEWQTQNTNVGYNVQDFEGSYTIPAAVMNNLRGAGTVIITRYRSITSDFNGKKIVGVRIAQRIYTVTVQ